MHAHAEHYMLGVGAKGQERLTILNEVCGPASRNLLQRAGISTGQTILEVGCGTGNMTVWLAQQVGPSGHVYAIDISEDQLTLAKQQAVSKGLNNITFLQHSVYDLPQLPSFDIAYGRFILMHISKPYEALQIMLQHLKQGGHLVCEENTNSATICYPSYEPYYKSRQLWLALAAHKGYDFNLGEKIYSFFYKLALQNIQVNFSQPLLRNPHEKLLLTLQVAEAAPNYIHYQLATESEMEEILNNLNHFIQDDSYFLSFVRITQIFGQKSG